jgi:alkylation response protein AidB-like acyl-CoA dehydrogenase
MTFSPDLSPVVQDVLHSLASDTNNQSAVDAWLTVSRLGWATIGVDENAGGSGGTLSDLAEIAAGLGRNAVSLPLLETAATQWAHAQFTGHIGGSSEVTANYAITQDSRLRFARAGQGWRVSGEVASIGWFGELDYLLVLGQANDEWAAVALTDPGQDPTITSETVAREFDMERSRLEFHETPVPADRYFADREVVAEAAAELLRRRALLRAAAMVGAAEHVCALTTGYVAVREQFGRPLNRMQAVAHSVARMMSERDLMTSAVQHGLETGEEASCAAALATAARSVGTVAAYAHQLHGAIGITREYPLHQFTRRLWAWRDEETTQRDWEHRAGLHALANGEAGVWSLLIDDDEV